MHPHDLCPALVYQRGLYRLNDYWVTAAWGFKPGTKAFAIATFWSVLSNGFPGFLPRGVPSDIALVAAPADRAARRGAERPLPLEFLPSGQLVSVAEGGAR